MTENKIVIIDLSGSRISAVAAEVTDNAVNILSEDSKSSNGIRHGIVENVSSINGLVRLLAEEQKPSNDIQHGIVEQMSGAAFSINGLVKLLQNSARIPLVQKVSVSLGAKSMKHASYVVTRKFRSNTKVTDELLVSMMEDAEKAFKQDERVTVFDVIPVSYQLDGRVWDNPVGQNAYEVVGQYNVIVGSSKITRNLTGCFDRTGLMLSHYSPIVIEAVGAAVLDDEDKENGCALIHFGHSLTTLAIYADGALQHLEVVPLGGNNITRDIKELGISELNAERLKCLKGSAMENNVKSVVQIKIPATEVGNPDVLIRTDFLTTIINARLSEICQPIFRSIEACPFELEAGIVITGGASKLNDITDFIAEQTELDVRYGDHSAWLADDADERYFDPSYSQLIGTILLVDRYNKENAEVVKEKEKTKEPKIKRSGLGEKIKNGVFNFFADDNKME